MSEQPSPPSRQRLTEQERGKLAWQQITEVGAQSSEIKKKYRTYARQFAALVQANGLAQTLAFLYAKAKWHDQQRGADERAAELMLRHINQALAPLLTGAGGARPSELKWLLDRLLQASSYVHRQATVEALAFARWLSRFAEAELPSEEDRPRGAGEEAGDAQV